ncbi:Protein of unknown function [Pyronema omphalodes CBS 100304]|uniref:Uncharacterized protein n=1 Tax=Pyronema omphalodes (strain CBS 100304) TaxID=1076935 RepID=U4L893_PYROM|nr:Protein of unknown function [Pyronema omphalodes CBS 100304]
MLSEALYGEERAVCLIVPPPDIAADPVVVPAWSAVPVYYYPSAPVMNIDSLFDLPHAGSVLTSGDASPSSIPNAADATKQLH